MKKQMATMLAAASISMAIAVPVAMAETSHMKTNSTTNQVNETRGHYDSRSYNDSIPGGYSNMSRSRSVNDNLYNTNSYNGYGTGTGTYGTNRVNAYTTTSHGNGWGWLGLLGLFGLAGMRREKHEGKPHHAK